MFQGDLSRNIPISLAPAHRVGKESSMPFTQSATGWLDKQVLQGCQIHSKIYFIIRYYKPLSLCFIASVINTLSVY